jgi:hypothetical protein
MKILIIGYIHHKNKLGLEMIFNFLKIEYKFSKNYIKGFDILYSPSENIVKNIPTFYGPHFSVFPNEKIFNLKKGIYIQPSLWVKELWGNVKNIPVHFFPFPVEIDKFKHDKDISEKKEVIIYFKRRSPKELTYLKEFLDNKKINYHLFSYNDKYNEENYLKILKNTKYMLVLDAHESQGFALEEAMSCNVPLLVWNVKFLNQEEGCNYPKVYATTIPYWDERCGEFFFEKEKFEETFEKFINNLNNYKPREFILENLSVEKCSKLFEDIIKDL